MKKQLKTVRNFLASLQGIDQNGFLFANSNDDRLKGSFSNALRSCQARCDTLSVIAGNDDEHTAKSLADIEEFLSITLSYIDDGELLYGAPDKMTKLMLDFIEDAGSTVAELRAQVDRRRGMSAS